MTSNVGPWVLVVDADEQEGNTILHALSAAGYPAAWRGNSVDGLVAVEDDKPGLVVLDWDMPYIDGETFARALQIGLAEPLPVVALVGPESDPAQLEAAGVSAWLAKPPDSTRLVQVVRELLSAQHRIRSS